MTSSLRQSDQTKHHQHVTSGLSIQIKVYDHGSVVPLGLWLPRGYDILTTDCGMLCLSPLLSHLVILSCDMQSTG